MASHPIAELEEELGKGSRMRWKQPKAGCPVSDNAFFPKWSKEEGSAKAIIASQAGNVVDQDQEQWGRRQRRDRLMETNFCVAHPAPCVTLTLLPAWNMLGGLPEFMSDGDSCSPRANEVRKQRSRRIPMRVHRLMLLVLVLALGELAQAQDIDIPYQKFVQRMVLL